MIVLFLCHLSFQARFWLLLLPTSEYPPLKYWRKCTRRLFFCGRSYTRTLKLPYQKPEWSSFENSVRQNSSAVDNLLKQAQLRCWKVPIKTNNKWSYLFISYRTSGMTRIRYMHQKDHGLVPGRLPQKNISRDYRKPFCFSRDVAGNSFLTNVTEESRQSFHGLDLLNTDWYK